MKREIIALTEQVTVYGSKNKKKVIARIDTGATKSSMDIKLASELELGPIIETKTVRSAHGTSLRPILKAKIRIKNKLFKSKFSLADRQHLKYSLLIGQNILKKTNFLIDPSKK